MRVTVRRKSRWALPPSTTRWVPGARLGSHDSHCLHTVICRCGLVGGGSGCRQKHMAVTIVCCPLKPRLLLLPCPPSQALTKCPPLWPATVCVAPAAGAGQRLKSQLPGWAGWHVPWMGSPRLRRRCSLGGSCGGDGRRSLPHALAPGAHALGPEQRRPRLRHPRPSHGSSRAAVERAEQPPTAARQHHSRQRHWRCRAGPRGPATASPASRGGVCCPPAKPAGSSHQGRSAGQQGV